MRNISIVIPNWNGLELIKESFDSFINTCQNYKGKSEIIVVDNGSDDRSVDVIRDFYPDIKVIALEKNYGFGHACNLGVQSSNYDTVLLLNNDITVPADFLSVLSNTFDQFPNAFSVSPHTNYWTEKIKTENTFSSSIAFDYLESGELIQCWAVHEQKPLCKGNNPTAYGTGAALMVDKSKFLKLGGFDSIYGLAYWEDVDLCVKAWRNGWSSYATDSTIAWHKISATSSKQNATPSFKENLIKLNYILFMLTVGCEGWDKWNFINKLKIYLNNQKLKNPAHYEFLSTELKKNFFKILCKNLYYNIFFWKSLKHMKHSTVIIKDSWRSQPILEV